MSKISLTEYRNAGLLLIGESFWSFQLYMTYPAAVLTVLLSLYGAGNGMIGAISAIDGGAIILTQIAGVYLFHSRHKRKRQVIAYHYYTILPLLLGLGVISWPGLPLSGAGRCWLLLACFAAMTLAIGVIIPVWSDWMAHLFRREIRGRVMGVSQFAAAGVGACGAWLGGQLIERFKDPSVYTWMYVLAFAIATASISMFIFVRDDLAREAPEPVPPTPGQIFERFRRSLRESNFRNFLIGRMLCTAGGCVAPFLVVFYKSAEGGSMDPGTVVSCVSAQVLATAAAVLLLGFLGDQRGHRIGMLAGAASTALALAMPLAGGGLASCILCFACLGVCGGSQIVSYTNILYETCPHDNRMAHLTLGYLAMFLPASVAPLLAGQVAEAFGLRVLFTICLAVSGAALAWFIFKTREPRDIEIQPPQPEQVA